MRMTLKTDWDSLTVFSVQLDKINEIIDERNMLIEGILELIEKWEKEIESLQFDDDDDGDSYFVKGGVSMLHLCINDLKQLKEKEYERK